MSRAEPVIFAALAQVDPAERAAYLDEAGGDDVELRLRVDRLLAPHPQVGSFLGAPEPELAGTLGEQPARERSGALIGPYKLLQQIGEGGMGVVWMAEQT